MKKLRDALLKAKSIALRMKLGRRIATFCLALLITGTSLVSVFPMTASAATIKESKLAANQVVAQAAKLLGTKYGWDKKGYSGIYTPGAYKEKSLATIKSEGIDCSGLAYYTLTKLGCKTTGFGYQNPVPVNAVNWLEGKGTKTFTYKGDTTNIVVEKSALSTKTYDYWEKADGSTITPGSIVVADNPNLEYGNSKKYHTWIYLGEFDSRDAVVAYLKWIGVSSSLITNKTVFTVSGKNSAGNHWRIEADGTYGVVINNSSDGKLATAMYVDAFRITENEVTYKVKKVDGTKNVTIGVSPVDGTSGVYGVYSDRACTNKVGEIKINSNGEGSIDLPRDVYYVKEITPPTGWECSDEVVRLEETETVDLIEEELDGSITINKTAEDGIIGDRTFKVTWTQEGEKKTKNATTNSKGVATFTGLDVYDVFGTGDPIKYTVEEIAETQYVQPKSQTVTLVTGEINGKQTLVILAEYLKKNPFAGRKQVADFLCKQHNFQIKEQDISFAEAFSGKSYFDLVYEGGFCDENGIMDTNIPDIRFYAEDILQGNIEQIVFGINS